MGGYSIHLNITPGTSSLITINPAISSGTNKRMAYGTDVWCKHDTAGTVSYQLLQEQWSEGNDVRNQLHHLSRFGVTPVTSQEEWCSVVSQLSTPSISMMVTALQRSKVKRTSCRAQRWTDRSSWMSQKVHRSSKGRFPPCECSLGVMTSYSCCLVPKMFLFVYYVLYFPRWVPLRF